jgi:PAS domain S-box-containing protein
MSNIKVLVVEDESIVALDIKTRLVGLGYTVVGMVPSGEEAVQKVADTSPDLVLMDINLRGQMDGVQAAEQIRSLYTTPVVFLTAFTDDETIQRAKLSEPFGYLVKPFEDRELHTTIEIALYRRQVEERLRASEEAERDQRMMAEALRDTAAVLNSTLDLDEVLDHILANVGRVVSYEAASIMLVEAGKVYVSRLRGYIERSIEPLMGPDCLSLDDTPLLREMVALRKSVLLSDVNSEQRAIFREADWITSYICVPIIIQEEVIGFLCLGSSGRDSFQPVHLDRLKAFADQAAVAIQNARLYQTLKVYSRTLEQRVEERTAELKQTKEQVEAILDSSADAVLLLDKQGGIERGNATVESMFGHTVDHILGHELSLLTDQAGADRLALSLARVLSSMRPQRLELLAYRNDRTSFDADVALAPVSGNSGVEGVVCSVRDISALKELERMKDAFVANVSHELRTPIANIKLYLRLLTLHPQKQDRYMSILDGETKRLERIVEDLLFLSLLDRRDTPPEHRLLDMNQLADVLVTDHLSAAESKGIQLAFHRAAEQITTQGDQVLLGHALDVLLRNAIAYTPAGGVVEVKAQSCLADDGSWVEVQVSDTGPGIPSHELPRVFERFFRGRTSQESGLPGTGLGLAIAKEIVERHHGQIAAQSDGTPGHGSTFTIRLPLQHEMQR